MYGEFLKNWYVAIGILMVLFLIKPLFLLIDLMVSHFFSFAGITAFFLFAFLEVSAYLLLLSFFIAIFAVVARMHSDREFIIFPVSGIRGSLILHTFIPLAGLCSLLLLVSLFFIVPQVKFMKRTLISASAIINPIKLFQPRSLVKITRDTTVYIGGIEGVRMKNIVLSNRDADNIVLTIAAKEATASVNSQGNLLLRLLDGKIFAASVREGKALARSEFATYRLIVPLQVAKRKISDRTVAESFFFGLLAISSQDRLPALFELERRFFFLLLPFLLLFTGYYLGVWMRISNMMMVVGAGAGVGLCAFYLLLLGEALVYQTGSLAIFWLLPGIWVLSLFFLRRRFFYVS